ncbi:MAG TPA: amidohydrolase family protein [Anaerolineales bacterium]|nr:amidohydrolase family protein [Anaerolineales bacterium]
MKLLHHARIYTLDQSKPVASVIAMEHGEVMAVGGDELLSRFDRVEKQDMGGGVILPGLTDAHLHLQHYSLALERIDCETDTLEKCLQRVAERVQRAKPGEWVLGHGWNQNVWGGWPGAATLDRIAPNHPVYLTAKSLHAAWVNSAALKLANITASTPDPKDGQIQHDSQGEPTGILFENAMQLIGDIVPMPDIDGLARAIEKAQSILWKMGLTGIHDFDRRDCFMALQQLHTDGKLKLRVTKNIPVDLLDHAFELGLRTGFGDDWLRIGSVKVFMDGALGPRTAAMFQPYLNESENRGILNMDGEELFELGRHAADVGLGMTVHAIGDRANHEVLNAYEQLRAYERKKGLPALRHRIEHVQVLHPDDTTRLAGLNVIASMQPIHATSDMLMADKYWGERSALAYAWRTQLQAGTHLAFGSDAPVESPNPFWGIHAAVTRRRADGSPSPEGWHPEQRLTMQEAIEGFTTGAAYAAYAENRIGKLAKGYLADLIVLDKDPFACDPEEVKDLQSSATMVGGDWVYP